MGNRKLTRPFALKGRASAIARRLFKGMILRRQFLETPRVASQEFVTEARDGNAVPSTPAKNASLRMTAYIGVWVDSIC
jgi:hypothetical protein